MTTELTRPEAEALVALLLERHVVNEDYTGSRTYHFKRGKCQFVNANHSTTRREINSAVEPDRAEGLLSRLKGKPD